MIKLSLPNSHFAINRLGGIVAGRIGAIAAVAAIVLFAAAPARGQSSPPAPLQSSTPTEQTPAANPTDPLPSMSDMLKVIEKASAKEDPAKDWTAPVRLAMVFAILAIMPMLLIMLTSFTRIVIVLGFVRRALATQSIPPTLAMMGLALFLTLFTMAPTFEKMNKAAIRPYLDDKISFQKAIEKGQEPLKDFMIRQTQESDMLLFINMAKIQPPATPADLPLYILIPAYAISEFRTAFEMGCLLFIPFLMIDMVISGILLSTGMMMLPPVMVSLPLKIILFVLVDGWRLLVETLVNSFR